MEGIPGAPGELSVTAVRENWPLKETFRISRAEKDAADVVVATVSDGTHFGRGECVPYRRYGETVASVLDELDRLGTLSESDALDFESASRRLDAGAARNALDCALWDWRTQRLGQPAWALLGLPRPRPVTTAYTIGIDAPAAMQRKAAANGDRALLKIKLGGADAHLDDERLRAVRRGAPDSELIVDANEGWTVERLVALLPVAEDTGVAMIEQPLPVGRDEALRDIDTPLLIGADESAHTPAGLAALRDKYQVVNIKLDKAGD